MIPFKSEIDFLIFKDLPTLEWQKLKIEEGKQLSQQQNNLKLIQQDQVSHLRWKWGKNKVEWVVYVQLETFCAALASEMGGVNVYTTQYINYTEACVKSLDSFIVCF